MRGEGKLPTSTGEGSLPISNHTMQLVAGSIWAGESKIRDGAQILWKNNFINLAIAAFPVTRHVVIAVLHVIEF